MQLDFRDARYALIALRDVGVVSTRVTNQKQDIPFLYLFQSGLASRELRTSGGEPCKAGSGAQAVYRLTPLGMVEADAVANQIAGR